MKVFEATIRDRRAAWIWWTVALLATLVLIGGSYSAIKGQSQLDRTMADLPESIQALLGIDPDLTLTSPAGYLNSQWFANFLPVLLSIYGIGVAARVIAGEEGEGRLELLLAHPVARLRVLRDRGAATALLLIALSVVTSLALVLLAPAFGLEDIGAGPLTAACAASLALALLHTVVTYGVGAATGSRGAAIAAGAALTGGGFLVQSLAGISETLRPVRWLSPWHWFIDARPVVDGWGPIVLPLVGAGVVAALVVAAGAWRFERRDIGSA